MENGKPREWLRGGHPCFSAGRLPGAGLDDVLLLGSRLRDPLAHRELVRGGERAPGQELPSAGS